MNNEKFIKNVLDSRKKYHEIITNHSFTNDEKDILLQASVNINKSKIDKTLINKAYDILISKSIKSTTENKDGSLTKAIQNYLDLNRKIKITDIPIIIIIALVVGYLILRPNHSNESQNITSHTSSQSSSYNKYGDVHGAWAYMQIFVEKRLKSPKSADFPFGGGTYHTTDLGNGRYEVNSYVDAENTFGANARTHFNGVIKRKDGGWVLEYLTFGDTQSQTKKELPQKNTTDTDMMQNCKAGCSILCIQENSCSDKQWIQNCVYSCTH